MSKSPSPCPNPRLAEIGRRNRALRKGFTAAGLERLRQAALANRPWEHATGPRTAEGKARSAANGKVRQKGLRSVRELRAEMAEFFTLVKIMGEQRNGIGSPQDRGLFD